MKKMLAVLLVVLLLYSFSSTVFATMYILDLEYPLFGEVRNRKGAVLYNYVYSSEKKKLEFNKVDVIPYKSTVNVMDKKNNYREFEWGQEPLPIEPELIPCLNGEVLCRVRWGEQTGYIRYSDINSKVRTAEDYYNEKDFLNTVFIVKQILFVSGIFFIVIISLTVSIIYFKKKKKTATATSESLNGETTE